MSSWLDGRRGSYEVKYRIDIQAFLIIFFDTATLAWSDSRAEEAHDSLGLVFHVYIFLPTKASSVQRQSHVILWEHGEI